MIVALICAAVVVFGIAIQSLARYVQRFGTDLRSPGPLIELRRTHVPTVQPADFDRLEGIVGDALVSDSHLDRQLLPLLASSGNTHRWAPSGSIDRGVAAEPVGSIRPSPSSNERGRSDPVRAVSFRAVSSRAVSLGTVSLCDGQDLTGVTHHRLDLGLGERPENAGIESRPLVTTST